ncbi:hypothetical protein SVAN01_07366 [Stagonosporopsis vannaccii]|nr:hypothetical protein SVAN01_07366 [Stagonosporopsis vannaccii]
MPSQEATRRMKDADYKAFLSNRNLSPSAHSELLFTQEWFNRELPPQPAVFTNNPNLDSSASAPASDQYQDQDKGLQRARGTVEQEGNERVQRDDQQLFSDNKPDVATPLPIKAAVPPDSDLGDPPNLPGTSGKEDNHNPLSLSHDSAEATASADAAAPHATLQRPSNPTKKPTPSRERRKLARLLTRIGLEQLKACRDALKPTRLTPAQLQHGRAHTVSHYEHIASEAFTVFHRFLHEAASRDIDVSRFAKEMRYRDGRKLGGQDVELGEAYTQAWKRFARACMAQAISEAAWGEEGKEQAVGVERVEEKVMGEEGGGEDGTAEEDGPGRGQQPVIDGGDAVLASAGAAADSAEREQSALLSDMDVSEAMERLELELRRS